MSDLMVGTCAPPVLESPARVPDAEMQEESQTKKDTYKLTVLLMEKGPASTIIWIHNISHSSDNLRFRKFVHQPSDYVEPCKTRQIPEKNISLWTLPRT